MFPNNLRRLLRPLTHRARDWIVKQADPLAGWRAEDSDFSHEDIIQRVKPYTMTTRMRIMALADAVEYVVRANIPGDIVECGVWRGGSMMTVALMLKSLGAATRRLWLYDTFEGMPAPSAEDVDLRGKPATETFEARRTGNDRADWCFASLEDVTANLHSTGYDAGLIEYVKGKVEDTIPQTVPERISLLRLDTDWYASTRHELEHLYPRLVSGGVLIIDDYGHWQGARQAVDEYLGDQKISLLLNRVDRVGRLAIKPSAS